MAIGRVHRFIVDLPLRGGPETVQPLRVTRRGTDHVSGA
jgi:hypothetical protein